MLKVSFLSLFSKTIYLETDLVTFVYAYMNMCVDVFMWGQNISGQYGDFPMLTMMPCPHLWQFIT